jgi:hypothetical protein
LGNTIQVKVVEDKKLNPNDRDSIAEVDRESTNTKYNNMVELLDAHLEEESRIINMSDNYSEVQNEDEDL